MIDYCKNVVNACESVLPTYHELALSRKTSRVPCISWQEQNNYESLTGDTRGYSYITFTLKVWANTIADIMKYSMELDKAMRAIGFKRTSSGELYDPNSTMIQKIMSYEALCLEDYK